MAQVVTVAGPISPDKLGPTMMHVHVLSHITTTELRQTQTIQTATDYVLSNAKVTMNILGWLRRHCYLNDDNFTFGDLDEMIDEIMLYKRMGGTGMVETSILGLGRDPVGLRKISGATGVNIIVCTGWYISPSHPPFVKEASIDELCDYMVRELTVGIDNTGIRAGMVKAAASSVTLDKPFTGVEEKVMRAVARAQAKTGAAMTIHGVHHNGRARHWDTYLDICKKEGANLEKLYISHMDYWAKDIDYQKSLADRGVTLCYDLFGYDFWGQPGRSYTPDTVAEEAVVAMLKAGYVKQIVMSNGGAMKTTLVKYGGYGYAHVLENVAADLRTFGVTEEQLHTMFVENPKRLLPF